MSSEQKSDKQNIRNFRQDGQSGSYRSDRGGSDANM